MLFNTPEFFQFLLLTFTVYWLLPRGRKVVLLLLSWYFLAYWDWRFWFLFFGLLQVNYWGGILLKRWKTGRMLALLVAIDLGALGVFKYAGFFTENYNALVQGFGFDHLAVAKPHVILPLAISFYTFQMLAYVIDIYRGREKPERNFVRFALFISFFPQLIAGPIVRSTELLPQLKEKQVFRDIKWRRALSLLFMGLFKKSVLADQLGIQVDLYFSSPGDFPGLSSVLFIYFYAFQIYFDFSGYTDIARGIGYLFGFEIPENFRVPYLALSITDFWRRWHMTLSRWLRDYLYIPLGGNRQGPWYTYRNLMLTMLLGGLWHGASWNFVVWGGLHGLYLAGERRFRDAAGDFFESLSPIRQFLLRCLAVFWTFHLVCLAWIFFRAPTFTASATVLEGLVSGLYWDALMANLDTYFFHSPIFASAAFYCIFLAAKAWADRGRTEGEEEEKGKEPSPIPEILFRGVTAYGILVLIAFQPIAVSPFIYFQF